MVAQAVVHLPPGVTIQMIRKANTRASKLGLAPRYAEIRTLRPNGTYVYHWVVVRPPMQTTNGGLVAGVAAGGGGVNTDSGGFAGDGTGDLVAGVAAGGSAVTNGGVVIGP